MIFDDKDKAAEAVEASKSKAPNEFCPLINANCHINCVCYGQAYYYGTEDGYIFVSGFCNNAMFNGN